MPLPCLKRCRVVATFSEVTATSCLAVVHVACLLAWRKEGHPERPTAYTLR